jgi:Mg-chelatase subunit ChlD
MKLSIRRQHLEACEGWLISAAAHLSALILFGLLLAPLAGNRSQVIEVESSFVDVGDEVAVFELAALPTVEPDLQPVSEPLPVESTELEILHPGLVRSRGRGGAGKSVSSTGVSDGLPTGEGDGNIATFFGTQAGGNRFVYVLDISTSMDGARLRRAVLELLRSIDQLHEHQHFYVITFSWKTRLMFDEESWLLTPIAATLENKQRLRNWLADLQTGSGTDPRDALRIGLRLDPDALFLLSDGEFNTPPQRERTLFLADPKESVIDVVRSEKSAGLPIHTVAFEIRQSEREMKKIATETDGTHRFVPAISPKDEMRAADQSLRAAVMNYWFSGEAAEMADVLE